MPNDSTLKYTYLPSYCPDLGGLLRSRVLDWMIEFIDTLYTPLRITGNYSAIADSHTLQFTVIHPLWFSAITSRNLATDLYQSYCHLKSYIKSSLHLPTQFNSSAPKLMFRQAGASKLDSITELLLPASELFLITTLHAPRRKRSISVVGKVCLQSCCIATKVMRLLLAYSLPRECVYRVVA
jgi:hypothetical protein